jgi:large subunit ribosomal protein L24
MKKDFSTKWKASKQPRKQRKFRAKAPLHLKKKFVSVSLSKELKKKHSKRNIPIKKGDSVKVMRGKFKGKKGKVLEVKLKLSKVIIEGIQVKKQDGSNVAVKLQPSNLQITELNLDDKNRVKKLGMKETKETKKEESKK